MDRESDVGSSENGSGRDTPRSLVDHESFRPDTPGPMPTYQYSKVRNIFLAGQESEEY